MQMLHTQRSNFHLNHHSQTFPFSSKHLDSGQNENTFSNAPCNLTTTKALTLTSTMFTTFKSFSCLLVLCHPDFSSINHLTLKLSGITKSTGFLKLASYPCQKPKSKQTNKKPHKTKNTSDEKCFPVLFSHKGGHFFLFVLQA